MPTGDFWWLVWPCAVLLAYVFGVATALIGVRLGAKYVFRAKFAPLGLEFDQPKPEVQKGEGAPVSYCPDLAMDEGYEVFNEPKPSAGAQRFREQFTGSPLAFIKSDKE